MTMLKTDLSSDLLQAGNKPEKLVRLMMVHLFTEEELANGSALGSRQAHNNKGAPSRPLDKYRIDVLKRRSTIVVTAGLQITIFIGATEFPLPL